MTLSIYPIKYETSLFKEKGKGARIMWECKCGVLNEDVHDRCFNCGAEMKPVGLTTYKEKVHATSAGVKRNIRINIFGLMIVFISIITFLAFNKIGSITYYQFTDYVIKCFAVWAISLVSCELVLVIGGFLLYLLRDRKRST